MEQRNARFRLNINKRVCVYMYMLSTTPNKTGTCVHKQHDLSQGRQDKKQTLQRMRIEIHSLIIIGAMHKHVFTNKMT